MKKELTEPEQRENDEHLRYSIQMQVPLEIAIQLLGLHKRKYWVYTESCTPEEYIHFAFETEDEVEDFPEEKNFKCQSIVLKNGRVVRDVMVPTEFFLTRIRIDPINCFTIKCKDGIVRIG